MNILYINYDNFGGGSTLAALCYVREMIARNHEVSIITRLDKGYAVELFREYGANVYLSNFDLSYYPNVHNPMRWFKNFVGRLYRRKKITCLINDVIISRKIDIVHTNIGPLPYALKPCKLNQIPHVWHHREYFDRWNVGSRYFPSRESFFKEINSNGNYNICITHGLLEYLGLTQNKNNRVIYDGVFSIKDIQDLKFVEKEEYFLYAGTINENKSLLTLIAAFSSFTKKYPDYKLKIAGAFSVSDSYYLKCKSYIIEKDIQKNVDFLGYRSDVRELMRMATAIVVPSIFEGFGFVMVEGMLCKTLLIGRDTTGTKEQFDIGYQQTGREIGLRFNNEEELIDAMKYAVENDTTEMREYAFKVVCNNYTIERCVNETESFYKHVINDYKNRIK